MTTVIEEPYASLATKIASMDALMSLLARDEAARPLAFMDQAPDAGGFPKLSWHVLTFAMPGPVDVDQVLYCSDTVQFDLWAATPDQLARMRELIDAGQLDPDPGLRDAHYEGALDTAHWRVLEIRRTGAWRAIDWSGRLADATGQPIMQLTSDWTYRYVRKQTVA